VVWGSAVSSPSGAPAKIDFGALKSDIWWQQFWWFSWASTAQI